MTFLLVFKSERIAKKRALSILVYGKYLQTIEISDEFSAFLRKLESNFWKFVKNAIEKLQNSIFYTFLKK